MAGFKLYTKKFCPYCTRAISILKSAGIHEYEEIPIEGRESEFRQKLMDLTGRWDVPQAFFGTKYLGDDDGLASLAQSGELQRLADNESGK